MSLLSLRHRTEAGRPAGLGGVLSRGQRAGQAAPESRARVRGSCRHHGCGW